MDEIIFFIKVAIMLVKDKLIYMAVIAVFIIAVSFIADSLEKRKGKSTCIKNRAAFCLFALSIGIIVSMTLCARDADPSGKRFSFDLFSSYVLAFTTNDIKYNILNIMLFMPLSFSLPLTFKKYEKFGVTLLTGFLLSGAIELTQAAANIGLFEIDDLLNNTIGTILGYGIYYIISRLVRALKKI